MSEPKAQNEYSSEHAAVTAAASRRRLNLTKGLGNDFEDQPPPSSRPDPLTDDQSPPRQAYDANLWQLASGNRNSESLGVARFFRFLCNLLLDISENILGFIVLHISEISVRRWFNLLVRPRVAKDAVRITWKCHCGTELYADYPKSDQEMVARLSQELKRPALLSPTYTTPPTAASTSPAVHASVHGTGGSGVSGPGNRPDSWYSAYGGSLATGPSGPHAPDNYIGAQTLIPKYLEVCVDTGKLRQSLREIDVTRFSGDLELFRWIRTSYKETRGRRIPRRFYLAPKSMRFVYFGVEQREKVHILCRDESLPPQEEIAAGRYHYTPCPMRPHGSMPMPSHTFVHYLHDCDLNVELSHTQRIWLDRLPKKMKEPLVNTTNITGGSTLVEAWGLHIVEGVNHLAVLWTIIAALLVTFVTLLGAYASAKVDLQGSTGVASVVLGTIALLTMCIQVEGFLNRT